MTTVWNYMLGLTQVGLHSHSFIKCISELDSQSHRSTRRISRKCLHCSTQLWTVPFISSWEILFVSGKISLLSEMRWKSKAQIAPQGAVHQNAPVIVAWNLWTAPAELEPLILLWVLKTEPLIPSWGTLPWMGLAPHCPKFLFIFLMFQFINQAPDSC